MVSTMSEYRVRRAQMIDFLGGACARCGRTDSLQFDHIDAKAKSFCVSKNWSRAWSTLVVELAKCQLLCPPHHDEKTRANREYGGGHNKLTECPHGTLYGYSGRWKCRCAECKAAVSAARKRYRSRM